MFMIARGSRLGSTLGIVAATATVASLAVGCQQPSPPPFAYTTMAFGSVATAAGGVNSGVAFPAGLTCTTTPGLHTTNTGASAGLAGFGQTGTATASGSTEGGSTVASNSAEVVTGVNLLGGLVHADTIHLTSRTSHDARGFGTAGRATLAGLNVAGLAVSSVPAPNKVRTLPGLGTVTINEQIGGFAGGGAYQITRGLHIKINHANLLGLPVGADLVVGFAQTGLSKSIVGLLDGSAYGANLKSSVDSVGVNSGSLALVGLPCQGNRGKPMVTSIARATLPGGTTVGKATSTARGVIDRGASSAETTSTVFGVNLLSSLVTATAVKADAHSGAVGTTKLFSDSGSQLANVRVRGVAGVLDKVKANTRITIAGVGTLYLHRVIRTPDSIEVRMIELVVTTPTQGLPVGADLKIGVAEASAH